MFKPSTLTFSMGPPSLFFPVILPVRVQYILRVQPAHTLTAANDQPKEKLGSLGLSAPVPVLTFGLHLFLLFFFLLVTQRARCSFPSATVGWEVAVLVRRDLSISVAPTSGTAGTRDWRQLHGAGRAKKNGAWGCAAGPLTSVWAG